MTEKEKKKYSQVGEYQLLEDIAHIRLRPGNYIGSTDEKGVQHLAREMLDNSVDEVEAGHCNRIEVIISDDQKSITIKDYGNGVPIDIHPKTKKTVLVTLLSFLKSSGKFSNKIYKTPGGLHGLGLTITNALSKEFKV